VQIGKLKIELPIYLAPMAGISDISFRTLMREMGAGIVVTELISSEALVRDGSRTMRMMRLSEQEHPAGIQIFGSSVEVMAESARRVEELGADFVDINLGCPVKKIVCQGAGAALLKDHTSLAKILSAVKKAITIPLTIKIRSGFDDDCLNFQETIRVATECGVSAVAIHGRTREQGYEGYADWQVIRQAKQQSTIPVVGNGDLITAAQALQRWQQSGCDAIMIGRGALRNPWIFLEIKALLDGKSVTSVHRDPQAVLQRHAALLEEYEEPRFGLLQIKKFLAWYSTGMRGGSHFRTEVFKRHDFQEIIKYGVEFFASQELVTGINEGERFLMGGHG
jgi:nifR3 family TIM-barrel protein